MRRAGSRSRIGCLEGNHANHYTTNASCWSSFFQSKAFNLLFKLPLDPVYVRSQQLTTIVATTTTTIVELYHNWLITITYTDKLVSPFSLSLLSLFAEHQQHGYMQAKGNYEKIKRNDLLSIFLYFFKTFLSLKKCFFNYKANKCKLCFQVPVGKMRFLFN